MDNLKKTELCINGILALIVLLTYCAVTVISLLKWNEAVSSALIMGFALLAKDVVSKMFDLLKSRQADEGEATAADTATPTTVPISATTKP